MELRSLELQEEKAAAAGEDSGAQVKALKEQVSPAAFFSADKPVIRILVFQICL